jgi:hypothetical protein
MKKITNILCGCKKLKDKHEIGVKGCHLSKKDKYKITKLEKSIIRILVTNFLDSLAEIKINEKTGLDEVESVMEEIEFKLDYDPEFE